jgi:rubrerythrin
MGNAEAKGMSASRQRLSRAALLSRGTRAGVALTVGGSALAALTPEAAADTLPDNDLAYVRLLVGAELLAIDYYTHAIATDRVRGPALSNMRHALANENAHYASLSTVLAEAGQAAATASDVDFTYPARSFASPSAILKLGIQLEQTMLGAYLGAVDGLQANTLKRPFAQIAANEAQHLSVLTSNQLGRPIGKAFATSLTVERASSVLDAFES